MANEKPKDVWTAGERYEPYVGRWSRLVAKELLRRLVLPPGREWLDVGCGTGALTATILEEAAPRAIKAIDALSGYIEYARAQVADPRVSFEVADAQSLPIESASRDAVVSGLVLNFLPQPQRAVAEMTRVLRPGGVCAAYVWDYAGKMELMRYFWDTAVALNPGAAELDEGRRAASRCVSRRRSRISSPAPACKISTSGRSIYPRAFATSTTIGRRFWAGRARRPATPFR